MKASDAQLRDWQRRGLIDPAPAAALGDLAVLVRLIESEGFGSPTPEFRFAPPRMFRFDLAWPTHLVAFEREGGKFEVVRCACGRKRTVFVSRHHSRKGLERDAEKYNVAAINKWCVIRATPGMISSGLAACHLADALRSRAGRSASKPAGDTTTGEVAPAST